MKYIKKFNDHSNYAAYIVGSKFINEVQSKGESVQYCQNQNEIHFNPYIPPKPKLLDILYSDANGNLSYTSEVLSVSEGKTPIGLCIAGEGFFGDNEPARWMSLKYMNYTTPDTGSLTMQNIRLGNNTDILSIDGIHSAYNGSGSTWGYLDADWITEYSSGDSVIPSLLDSNNNWNISVLGNINEYVVTDIDGKNKTTKFLSIATDQLTWQTDTSIINNYNGNYAPAACCCWRYHTLGTQAGDWYLGAGGEMCMIIFKSPDINTKLTAINAIYPNDCIDSLASTYWTSTEYDNGKNAYFIKPLNGYISNEDKRVGFNILALLQY
jgi:hypothetical protein